MTEVKVSRHRAQEIFSRRPTEIGGACGGSEKMPKRVFVEQRVVSLPTAKKDADGIARMIDLQGRSHSGGGGLKRSGLRCSKISLPPRN